MLLYWRTHTLVLLYWSTPHSCCCTGVHHTLVLLYWSQPHTRAAVLEYTTHSCCCTGVHYTVKLGMHHTIAVHAPHNRSACTTQSQWWHTGMHHALVVAHWHASCTRGGTLPCIMHSRWHTAMHHALVVAHCHASCTLVHDWHASLPSRVHDWHASLPPRVHDWHASLLPRVHDWHASLPPRVHDWHASLSPHVHKWLCNHSVINANQCCHTAFHLITHQPLLSPHYSSTSPPLPYLFPLPLVSSSAS